MYDKRSRNVNELWVVEGKMGSKDKIALGMLFHPVLCRMCTRGEGPEESHVSHPTSGTDLGV